MIIDTCTINDSNIERAARAMSPHNNYITLLDPDNKIVGDEQPWTLAIADQPYMVRLTCPGAGFHTIFFDFDDKLGTGRGDSDSLRLLLILEAIGVRAVRAASGSAGGRHLIVTIRGDHLRANDARALAEGLRKLGLKSLDPSPLFNRTRGSSRPLLAVHKSGNGRSLPLDHTIAEALVILEDGNDPAPLRVLARQLRLLSIDWPLPHTPLDVLASPSTRSDRSGSADVQAIITRYVVRRRPAQDCMTHLMSLAAHTKAGTSVQKRLAKGTFEAWFRRSWSNAQEYVACNPARYQDIKRETEVIDTWLRDLPAAEIAMDGRSRRTARLLLHLAVTHQRVLIGLSQRIGATLLGMDPSSINRALNDLVAAGFITRAGRGSAMQAERYRLNPSSAWACAGAPVSPTHVGVGGVGMLTGAGAHAPATLAADLTHDLWHRKGLGEQVRFVYEKLVALAGPDGVTATGIAAVLGITRGTAARHLGVLADHGLARGIDCTHWTSEWRDPDEIAAALPPTASTTAWWRGWRPSRSTTAPACCSTASCGDSPTSTDQTSGPREHATVAARTAYGAAQLRGGPAMTAMPHTDTLLTSAEVAERLNVGERYVRRLVAERRLPYVKIGAKVRFTAHDLDKFVVACRREILLPLEPEEHWRAWLERELSEDQSAGVDDVASPAGAGGHLGFSGATGDGPGAADTV